VILAHAMLLTLRGVPVVYYGDEQGFAGLGGDQDARQDMFASQVAIYNGDPLVGTASTTAVSNFNRDHPLYRAIAELASLRATHAALRRGKQIVRSYSGQPGLFAVSRLDPRSRREIVIAFNTSTAPLTAQVEVGTHPTHFTALHGNCAAEPSAPASYPVSLAPLDYVICAEADGS
jgi:glycosidase